MILFSTLLLMMFLKGFENFNDARFQEDFLENFMLFFLKMKEDEHPTMRIYFNYYHPIKIDFKKKEQENYIF
jgi:hypothetical protein